MNTIKRYLAVAGLVSVAVVITWLLLRSHYSGQIERVQQDAFKQIDSVSVVARNMSQSRDQIADSLETLDADFSEYIQRTDDEIASYSRIVGRLRLDRDSISDSLRRARSQFGLAELMESIDSSASPDTTLRARQTWSDSLLATEAIARVSPDSLFLESELVQLRDLRIDVVTTVSDDQDRVYTYVRSTDLDSMYVSSVTEIEPKRRKPWGRYLTLAFIIREAVKLIR